MLQLLVQTIHTCFSLPDPCTWEIRKDLGRLHEVHFRETKEPSLVATDVVAIYASGRCFVGQYPNDGSERPTITLKIPGKRPLWNVSNGIYIPHPLYSTCHTEKSEDGVNPGWKVWKDLQTGKELLRINTFFLAEEAQ